MDPNLDAEWELFCNGTWTCYQGSRIRDQRLSVMQGPSTAELHRRRGKRLFPNQGAWLSGGLRYQCSLMHQPC